ncbi:MAG TPA: DnaB-like helicase C-terminal domain-containing protein [Bacteroidia bacterium]|nr:DnaB-like helicase C-terminal domain-containing protein [Bacteroidia bacterium]
MLPHAEDVERGLLNQMLLGYRTPDSGASAIFYIPAHSIIAKEIHESINNQLPVDFNSLLFRLSGNIDEVGGREYISQLYENTIPNPAIAEYYFTTLLELADRRHAILTARQIEEKSSDSNVNFDEISSLAVSIKKSSTKQESVTNATSLATEFVDYLERLQDGKIEDRGIEWGFDGLPGIIRKIRPGELCLIGGYPGAGKTSLANSTIAHTCIPNKIPTLIFSMEMTKHQETMRIISISGKVPLKRLLGDEPLRDEDYSRITESIGRLHQSKVSIIDQVLSIGEVAAEAKTYKQSVGLDLVVIDHAQLVRTHLSKNRQEYQELDHIGQVCKWMAKELDCSVMLLTQLNRADGLPYGSSMLWAHTDQLIIVNKPDPGSRVTTLEIKKHRNGPEGTCKCSWWAECAAFYNGNL